MNNSELSTRDLNVIWHPCTQMKDHEFLPMIPIRSGQGVWLEDHDGNRYIDAISSWWVNIFGHCHPEISRAISDQADMLEHTLLAGFTHQPVIELSEKLVALTPDQLQHCFYADNGSAAVEIALKMSFQYWRNKGHNKKTRFVNLSNSYHGETLGALSVGHVELYKSVFEPLLFETFTAPSPDCFFRDENDSWQTHSEKMFNEMEALLARHADEICAVIVEPLVQCAGYMRMYHPVYLTKLREACDQYNVHLIADEIAVGFGRTGALFACEQGGITPDFMCLGKGLTGGYLPLSVCLTTNEIYNAFYDDYIRLTAFLHSHSYTGNPLACAAANATLDLFEQHNTIEKNKALATKLQDTFRSFTNHPHIAEVRQTGMILAIELAKNKKTPYAWEERRGLKVYQHALEKGAILRPLGHVVYIMPPYVINAQEIEKLAEIAWEGIELATR